MELLKKEISYGIQRRRIITQLTFDDDINVSDHNADIRSIIMQTGHVRLDEVRALGNRIRIMGHLEFSILYSSEDEGMVSCVKGDFAFEEMINDDEGREGEMITALWDMEDLRAQVIHSRKMNVKAVVTLSLYPVRLESVEAARDVSETPDTEVLKRNSAFTGLKICGKDTLRVRETFLLPGGKADVDRIIFQDVGLRNVKTRPENGRVEVSGEISLFLLYRCADEHAPVQWLERQFPISGQVESAQAEDLMLSASCIQLAHTEVTAEEDEDGEIRKISVEAVLQCDLMLYEEQQAQLLEDVYVPKMEFEIERPDIRMTVLDHCNDSRMKMNMNLALHGEKPLVQVVYTGAEVKVEDYRPGEDGILLEGVVFLTVLYQQADPEIGFVAKQQEYPFTYTVQLPKEAGKEDSLLQITSTVEQVTAVLSGADEVQVRLIAGFRLVSCREMALRPVTGVNMVPVPAEKMESMPGIIGYMVKPRDTLWSVARKFYVPLSSIREVNALTTDEIQPGQRLLIVKQ